MCQQLDRLWRQAEKKTQKRLELSITGIILVPKNVTMLCELQPKRWMQLSWWVSWASAGSRSFSWATMKTWLDRDAAAGMGLLPHRQISHSIQTFSPTGTFTWLSLWSASSSSASSPSSFAPVAELPPKNTTEEWFHPQLLHVCLKGSFSFQTRVPFQTSMRRCLSGSSSFMILSFSALFFSSRRVWAASWRWACVCFRKFSSTRARFLSAFCLPWRQGGDSKPAAAPSSYGCNNLRGWVPLTSLLRRSFLTLSML